MENTLENKAKLFALYWGQIVAKITKGSYTHPLDTIHIVDKNVLSSVESEDYVKHKYSLELTHISLISDEDAIRLFNLGKYQQIEILRTYAERDFVGVDFKWVDDLINNADGYSYSAISLRPSNIPLNQGMLAISMGYYIGDGTEIDYGWVKLKEPTK